MTPKSERIKIGNDNLEGYSQILKKNSGFGKDGKICKMKAATVHYSFPLKQTKKTHILSIVTPISVKDKVRLICLHISLVSLNLA